MQQSYQQDSYDLLTEIIPVRRCFQVYWKERFMIRRETEKTMGKRSNLPDSRSRWAKCVTRIFESHNTVVVSSLMANNPRDARAHFPDASRTDLGPDQRISAKTIVLGEHHHVSSFRQLVFHRTHHMDPHLDGLGEKTSEHEKTTSQRLNKRQKK